jgi:hypothetical protein
MSADRRPLVVAADWSIDPRKRRMCIVRPREGDAGAWVADAPREVGETATLAARLCSLHNHGPVLLGLDVPIGLPRAYALRTELSAIAEREGFRGILRHLTADDRRRWFSPTNEPTVDRPFFPARLTQQFPGARAHLAAALGLNSTEDLLRRCDHAHAGRNAQSIFFTCGAAQVGKAAISAWLEVLRPLLEADAANRVGLWPFDGALNALLAAREVVVAEIYPADAGTQLALSIGGVGTSKRDLAHRRAMAPELRRAMRESGVSPTRALASAIRDGFDGEDDLDAFIAAIAMTRVVRGDAPSGEPADDPAITACEGWILGRSARASHQAVPSHRRSKEPDRPAKGTRRRSEHR